jgi:hypothetical protein
MSLTVPPLFDAGTVTQLTDINTAVTLNTQSGIITTVSANLTANLNDTFTLNNSNITNTCFVIVSVVSVGGTGAGIGAVTAQGQNQRAGAIDIVLSNSDNAATTPEIFQVAFLVMARPGLQTLTGPPLYSYGVVNQATNFTTAVTLNAQSGKIITQNANVAAEAASAFTLTNNEIRTDSVVLMSLASGGSIDADTSCNVLVGKSLANGSIQINYANAGVTNPTPTAPVEINFLVLDPVGGDLQSPPLFTTGTVTQLTNINTAVTLNTQAGTITTVTAATAGADADDFFLNNSQINADSRIFVFIGDYSGGIPANGMPQVAVTGITAGRCTIRLMNTEITGGAALDGTCDISFLVL